MFHQHHSRMRELPETTILVPLPTHARQPVRTPTPDDHRNPRPRALSLQTTRTGTSSACLYSCASAASDSYDPDRSRKKTSSPCSALSYSTRTSLHALPTAAISSQAPTTRTITFRPQSPAPVPSPLPAKAAAATPPAPHRTTTDVLARLAAEGVLAVNPAQVLSLAALPPYAFELQVSVLKAHSERAAAAAFAPPPPSSRLQALGRRLSFSSTAAGADKEAGEWRARPGRSRCFPVAMGICAGVLVVVVVLAVVCTQVLEEKGKGGVGGR